VALGLTLTGCGAATKEAPVVEPQTSDGQALIATQYPECAAWGERVYRYLITGNNQGLPELDNAYALFVGAEPPVARAMTNEAISECSANEVELEASRAQALADAQRAADDAARKEREARDRAAQQRQAAEEQARLDRVKAENCAAIHGEVANDGTCRLVRGTLPGNLSCNAWLSFKPDGTVSREWMDGNPDNGEIEPRCYQ